MEEEVRERVEERGNLDSNDIESLRLIRYSIVLGESSRLLSVCPHFTVICLESVCDSLKIRGRLTSINMSLAISLASHASPR